MSMKKIKDPGSAITHFIGMVLALLASVFLLVRSVQNSDPLHTVCFFIFMTSMILLYCASTTYHTFDIGEKWNKILRKIDHSMIFVLIAGTYTPVCVLVLHNTMGYIMLAAVWGIALGGILLKLLWIDCPKWFSSVLYIAMGWICVLGFSQILAALPRGAFYWLLAGGIIYTIGGIIYALKLPVFNQLHKAFGSHEIFHLFVMAGSFCHFMVMYQYVVYMPA